MARRQFSKDQKMQMVKEIMQTGNASLVARRNNVADSVIRRWLDKYKQYGDAAFGPPWKAERGKPSPLPVRLPYSALHRPRVAVS